MKHNTLQFVAAFLVFAALGSFSLAQDKPVGKGKLGIGKFKTTVALIQATTAKGQVNQLNRVVESMDAQLMDALHNSRKFTLVARSDLGEVLGEQKLAESGNVDTDDAAAAKAFKLAGCQYLIVTTVDNFQDFIERATFANLGETSERRIVQFSCVAKIYDTTSGTLLESANFQLDNSEVDHQAAGVGISGDLKERLFTQMARQMSQRITDRVIDVIYPAKIIARTDKTVTINRGDGTSVAPGQLWEAFALGEELKDPDTGASLGREEVKVGSIRITSIQPLVSKGEVVEDKGVDKGQIIRPVLSTVGTVPPK